MKKPIVAVITLLVAVTAALAIRWLAFPNGHAQPATVQVSPAGAPTLPTTEAALAAAARRHMPADAKLVHVRSGGSDPSHRMYVMLDYEIDERTTTLGIEATKEMSWAADYCEPDLVIDQTCETRTLGDGTKVAVYHLGGGKAPSTGVSTQRAGHSVWITVWPSSGVSDLPVSFDVLAAIAADPLIGFKTSRQMLDLGRDVSVTPL